MMPFLVPCLIAIAVSLTLPAVRSVLGTTPYPGFVLIAIAISLVLPAAGLAIGESTDSEIKSK